MARDGMTPEDRAKREAERKAVDRLLEERIAYHEARIAEQRAAASRPKRRLRFLFR
jgi:hypothetical protein